MANSTWFSSMVLLFLVVSMISFDVSMAGGEGSLTKRQCPAACASRCSSLTFGKMFCKWSCNKCCAKCLCVPSGTSGHRDECPCYGDWYRSAGPPMCP
ncbi:gibberellin-regulated protein 12-like [Spinacia oleracea]|uniref:Gibberellin-regulated protein 12-like n=1 Tax=Spinacia oleracea TaxID=3562 RepID=A0ABM3RT87_SPIOL|nr:gibberellin-regulated protein 12-like [Spinacia oleracea]